MSPDIFGNALPADVVWVFAGDDLEIELRILLAEGGTEVGTEVLGGFDVAAENDGVESFFEPLFEDDGGGEEFAIVLDGAEFFEPLGEGFQLTALVFGPVALFEDLGGGVVAFEAVVEVADGVFGFGGFTDCRVGIRRCFGEAVQPGVQHLHAGVGAGHDAAQEGEGGPVLDALLSFAGGIGNDELAGEVDDVAEEVGVLAG